MLLISVQEVICQTWETVFHWDIEIVRRELKIQGTVEYCFYETQGAWLGDETLSRVFDVLYLLNWNTKE